MKMDLVINFGHPDALSHTLTYARIDNVVNPVYKTIAGITESPYSVQNIDNGQYRYTMTPVYADGRKCDATANTTPACPGIISMSAVQSGTNIQVQYVAPGSVPQVYLTVNYPNGGSFKQAYTNGANGSTITVPIPANVFGTFVAYMQSICDPNTGFYSPLSSPVTVTVVAGDSFVKVNDTNTGPGGTRTQTFQTGPSITPGVTYFVEVYSHQVAITAVSGDTPSTMTSKLATAINATTESQWNSNGDAPPHGTNGFPPTATSSGNQLIITLNYQNQFISGVTQ